MTARAAPMTPSQVAGPATAMPAFEARLLRHGAGDTEIEVWQLPSPASP